MAIPKILHYCWFGHNDMKRVEQKCVKRWMKYFNDYKIMKWDESNFDINCNDYVKEAYQAKKYAYVSDYARLKALYEYGGIYLDVDCKVLKRFDNLLNQHAFTGFGGDNKEIAACALAFEPKDPYIKECLESYNNNHFLLDNSSYNYWSINQRMTKILEKYGFLQNGKEQIISGIHIYPMTYFCPLSMLPDLVNDCKTKMTYSIALWTNKELIHERRFVVRLWHKIKKIRGERNI